MIFKVDVSQNLPHQRTVSGDNNFKNIGLQAIDPLQILLRALARAGTFGTRIAGQNPSAQNEEIGDTGQDECNSDWRDREQAKRFHLLRVR